MNWILLRNLVLILLVHLIDHMFSIEQQVPAGAVMVDGSPVFLSCQDQEVLEVAKAVLREKFPQVLN